MVPKYARAAEERSMYASPSHMKLGVVDRVFQDQDAQATEKAKNLPTATRAREGAYPNIFSTRTLNPIPSDLRSSLPKAPLFGSATGRDSIILSQASQGQMRPEVFLQKITSEKRNKAAHRRFANSGFGKEHGHKYFVRKLS